MKATQIHIEDLRVDCKIGVWTHERNTTQQIRVDLTVEFDAGPAARTDALQYTLNYADLAREATFIMEAGEFLLLESAAWMICQWALLPPKSKQVRPRIQAIDVKLTKFGALPGSTLASVQQSMRSEDVTYADFDGVWGAGQLVGETDRLSISRQVLTTKPPPVTMNDVGSRGSCLILDGVVDADGVMIEAGRSTSWKAGHRPALQTQDAVGTSHLLVVEAKAGHED